MSGPLCNRGFAAGLKKHINGFAQQDLHGRIFFEGDLPQLFGDSWIKVPADMLGIPASGGTF
jgi:hypothetical protein